MATGPRSVLRKKLSKTRSRGYNFPVQNQMAGKVEFAMARGVTSALGVATEVIVEDSRVTRLGSLIDALPVPGLFVVLHTATGDQALAGLDMRLVDHVVDIIAGGDPTGSDSLPARTPTTLDAAFCTQMIDAIMGQLYMEIQALGGEALPERFENGRIEYNPTNLHFLLSEQQYLSIRATLDIGDSARSGYFYLALPLSWIEPVEAVLQRISRAPAQRDSSIWRQHMRSVVRRAPIALAAVIDSFPLQVADIAHLEVGKVFPLSGVSLDDVRLELNTGDENRVVARGRLGIHKRNKAIRIAEPLHCGYFDVLIHELAED